MTGIFSTLLFTRKLIVKYKFAVRAFKEDPGGSRTHRHGDFQVPTQPLSYGSDSKIRFPCVKQSYIYVGHIGFAVRIFYTATYKDVGVIEL